MGFGDAQIGQQEGDWLGGHGEAAVGVNGELSRLDVLLLASVFEEPLGQFGALARRDHPADDVAAEDIEDDVQVEAGQLGRAEQLGDAPAPELIGSGRQQFRLLIRRVRELVAALPRSSLVVPAAGTGCESSSDTGLHRGVWRRWPPASGLGIVPGADKPTPFPARPD